ncbi:MAG: DJ-1/PfpI family protein [Candidatus Firestonebacteria bacterium]
MRRFSKVVIIVINTLLLLTVNCDFTFPDAVRKKVETDNGTEYKYYDSEGNEITGGIPDGIVRGEDVLLGMNIVTEENYLNGKKNGLSRTIMKNKDYVNVSENNFVDGVMEGKSSTVMNMAGMSSRMDYFCSKGLINGIVKTITFDKDGSIMFSMEMTMENSKPIGNIKMYDKDGNYDAKMSQGVNEAMAKKNSAGGFIPQQNDVTKDGRLAGKKVLVVNQSEKDSEKDLKMISGIIEAGGGKTVVTGKKLMTGVGDIKDFDAIILLGCSASTKSFWENEDLIELIKEAGNLQKVIAAVGFSPLVLAKAGILKGKEATITETDEAIKVFNECEVVYIKKDVIVSEKVVTAGSRNVLKTFAEEVVKLLENTVAEE